MENTQNRDIIEERYTLYHGNCLEKMALIPDGSVDLVLCDLPYGTTQNKWDVIIDFEELWTHYNRVLKPSGAIVLFSSQPFTAEVVISNKSGFKYAWVWEKTTATGHLNAKVMPMKLHEDICVFALTAGQKIKYNPQGLVPFNKKVRRGGNGDNFGKSGTENFQEFTNYPRSILKFGLDKDKHHPTQKPVALLEYLIRTYTDVGETILDNTMGSGSTGVAAINTDRKFIGIEMTEKYFDIAADRLEKAANSSEERTAA